MPRPMGTRKLDKLKNYNQNLIDTYFSNKLTQLISEYRSELNKWIKEVLLKKGLGSVNFEANFSNYDSENVDLTLTLVPMSKYSSELGTFPCPLLDELISKQEELESKQAVYDQDLEAWYHKCLVKPYEEFTNLPKDDEE